MTNESINYLGKLIKAESNDGWRRISGRVTFDDGEHITVVNDIYTHYIKRSTFTNIQIIPERG